MRVILYFLWLSVCLSFSVNAQTFTILYTNNNNGNISACDCGDEPRGGLARRKAFFDALRKQNSRLLALDAGDFLNGFGFNRPQDSLVILLYKRLNYDAINIGEQEFSNGFDFFYRRVRPSTLPLVSANLYYNDTLLTQPYILRKLDGIHFGITGYTPQESFRYLPNKHLLPLNLNSSFERLSKTIRTLKSQCDIIIVLSQAGYDEDGKLAKSLPEIDILIGGHTQMEINEKLQTGKTIIAQAGSNGEWVGVLTIRIQNKKIVSFDNALQPMNKLIREDAAIQQWIQNFK